MADVPSVVNHGRITGYFTQMLSDSAADVGEVPDEIPMSGRVRLTATPSVIRFAGLDTPQTSLIRSLTLTVRDGYIVPPDAEDADDKFIVVLATDQPAGAPDRIVWKATFLDDLAVLKPVEFEVPTDGTVDLTTVLPAEAEPGTVQVVVDANSKQDVATLDGDVAAKIDDDGSDVRASLNATIDTETQPIVTATAASAAALVQKLKRDVEDATVLYIGDSTNTMVSTENKRASRLVAEDMATLWPTHTVAWRQWDTGTNDWGTVENLNTGTGGRTLNWYNGGVSGSRMDYFLGDRFDVALANLQPDLVIVNYGLNDGANDVNGAARYGGARLMMLTEAVKRAVPYAQFIVLTQNERLDTISATVATRAQRYAEVCGLRGYGLIDTRQALLDDPGWPSVMMSPDNLHPSPEGSRVIADTILPYLRYDRRIQPRPSSPTSLSELGVNLLSNGDFAAFAGAVPDDWSLIRSTSTKDTTNFEAPHGWAVRLEASEAGSSYIEQLLPLATVRGQYVTVAARVRVPASFTAASAARVELAGGAVNLTTPALNTYARDRFTWVFVTGRVLPDASLARVRVYADSASNADADITIDRVVAVLGVLPKDIR
ncbi:SGNH/GDSL hydrolase family protein [Demequina sp. SO4-18]|uniref:SGNH/GDSL hydrolase family protein n=1 Tax=Demequina sp. SO4-18 TaxID=3401026 RepID=UPI003B5B9745